MDTLRNARLIDEDTVLPAVPLWFDTLDPARAQLQIDHLGGGALATDWGSRILSERSELYDPLSYHYGSVWPLFTGWASMGAYRYGRPHVGFQALMANALLTYDGALGYVTELLSGEFNAAFGRSSHHQVWSEAMVVTPVLRGSARDRDGRGGRRAAVCAATARELGQPVSSQHCRGQFAVRLHVHPQPWTPDCGNRAPGCAESDAAAQSPTRIILAPAFPLDAVVRAVSVDGRAGEIPNSAQGRHPASRSRHRRAQARRHPWSFSYDGGSDVYQAIEAPLSGDRNEGLRVLRSRAGRDDLQLTLEGRAGRAYSLRIRTPRRAGAVTGGELRSGSGDAELLVRFEGTGNNYVRKEVKIALGSLLR